MKTPEMEEFLDNFAKQAFGHSRKDDCCVVCGSKKIQPEDFKDTISQREFAISRMCQVCQDKIWVGQDEL